MMESLQNQTIFDFTIAVLCLSLQISWFSCDYTTHDEPYCI